MIDPLPLLSTEPLVRRASVETDVGAMAAVTKMFPELEPIRAPIRNVPADTRLISALVRETRPVVSLPKSNGRVLVLGAMVTTPLVEVVARLAEISTASETTSI